MQQGRLTLALLHLGVKINKAASLWLLMARVSPRLCLLVTHVYVCVCVCARARAYLHALSACVH